MSEFIIILCCAHCAVVLVSRQVVKTGLRKLLFTTNPCRCLLSLSNLNSQLFRAANQNEKLHKWATRKQIKIISQNTSFPSDWHLNARRRMMAVQWSWVYSTGCARLCFQIAFFFKEFQTTSSLNIICKIICFVQKLSFYCNDRLGWLDLARQAAIFEGQETLIYALLHFYAASTAQCSSMLFCFTCLLLRYYAATVWWGTGQDKGHWGLLSGNL